MAGRASIVGAAETNVGNVRDHNEDSHFIDPELGIFIVCDGMGGHAAGEVASSIAVQTIRTQWANEKTQRLVDRWLQQGTPETHKELLAAVIQGVVEAHEAIVDETDRDANKIGMGTTLIGALVVGSEVIFAHAGDSRAYLVRDGIAMQLTEDQTLLSRLLAAGVDVDVHGEGARFKSMLTNAIGIGMDCRVVTFIVPLADGDRFLLCSDGVTEYIEEAEIGEVLCKMPSPARAAQRLVDLALERGGADNATALVIRVLEAGDTARPSELLRRENLAIKKCPLWAKVTPQQRLRALRIALPRDYEMDQKIPAQTLGDRVAWIVVEGELEQDDQLRGPGSLIYPEALLRDAPLPGKDELAIAQSDLRLLALRADDFRELCEDDPELGEHLLGALAAEIALRQPLRGGRADVDDSADPQAGTDPGPQGPRRSRPNTDLGIAPPERPSQHAVPAKLGLIASATDVEGDFDRAMNSATAEREAQQLEPADDEDAEIVVEPRVETSEPEIRVESGVETSEPEIRVVPEPPPLSDPDIEIETLAAAADEDEDEGEDDPAATEVRELEAEEPSEEEVVTATQAAAALRSLEEDDLDAEWARPEISEVKAAEAIRVLEQEQEAERAVAELDKEHGRPSRPPSELQIEERHEVAIGELDDDESGRVIEILKDTSSQTITMTVQEQADVAHKPQSD